MWWLAMLGACGGADEAVTPVTDADACGGTGEEILVVNRVMRFSREEDGVSEGFNLDAETTAAGDPTGCGIADFVGPDGTVGVDNAFARMIPALEATEAQAVEELVQATINSGELLLMVRLTGVDDLQQDDCVTVEVLHAEGQTFLGNDGYLLPNQTFALEAGIPVTRVSGATIVDGTVRAEGLDIRVPIQIFDVALDLQLLDGVFQLTPTAAAVDTGVTLPEGSYAGLMAGGVETAAIQGIADSPNVDNALSGLVAALLSANADMKPVNGVCSQVSMTFRTEAVRAFLLD
jgi:hypothetical protein